MRKIIKCIHPVAGVLGFCIILSFWISTVLSELFSSPNQILHVKNYILSMMWILIPMMIIVGTSGFKLGGTSTNNYVLAKRKRMPLIGLNGILVLLPCALFLQQKASLGLFDKSFMFMQGVELLAGGLNIMLMALSIRDGLRFKRRLSAI